MARRGRKPNLSLRNNILSYLSEGPQTVAQCATECGSNPVTTKSHINALVDLGLIQGGDTVKHVDPETGEARRGRPAQLFEVTEAGNAALALEDTTAALTPLEPVTEAPSASSETASEATVTEEAATTEFMTEYVAQESTEEASADESDDSDEDESEDSE